MIQSYQFKCIFDNDNFTCYSVYANNLEEAWELFIKSLKPKNNLMYAKAITFDGINLN
jgi:hypothetical protein